MVLVVGKQGCQLSADQLDVPNDKVLRHAGDRCEEEHLLDWCTFGVGANFGRHSGRVAKPVVAKQLGGCLAKTFGISRFGDVGRALGAVDLVGVDVMGDVPADRDPVRIGILGDPGADGARHPPAARVMTACDQPVAVGRPVPRIGGQQVRFQQSSAARPLWTLVTHPQWDRVLHGRRSNAPRR